MTDRRKRVRFFLAAIPWLTLLVGWFLLHNEEIQSHLPDYSSAIGNVNWHHHIAPRIQGWFEDFGLYQIMAENAETWFGLPLFLILLGFFDKGINLTGAVSFYVGWVFLGLLIFVLYAFAYFFALIACGVLFLIGLITLYAARTGKALVTERRIGKALSASVLCAGALTGGLLVGSFALYFLAWPFGGEVLDQEVSRQVLQGAMRFWAPFVDLIAADSVWVFLKLIPVCFLANRFFVAKSDGGRSWLGVIPPLTAMTLFAIWPHAADVIAFLQDPSWERWYAALSNAWEYMRLPFDLITMAIEDTTLLLEWLDNELTEAGPSFFRLAHLYPMAFIALGLGMVWRSFVDV